MNRDCTDAGFTLLELLAGIFVFGFVVVLLSQGFRFGVQASRLTAAEHGGDRQAVEQSLRRLVGAADPGIYPEPASLRGGSGALELTTELPGGDGGAGFRADGVISAATGRLVLRWRPHRHVEWFGPGPGWTETVLAEGVARVEFGYLAAGVSAGWVPAWAGERLPALVRVVVVFADHGGTAWPPIIVAPVREPLEE